MGNCNSSKKTYLFDETNNKLSCNNKEPKHYNKISCYNDFVISDILPYLNYNIVMIPTYPYNGYMGAHYIK